MLNHKYDDIVDFVKWVRDFTGKAVNVQYSLWAHTSATDVPPEPKIECRLWIEGIVNISYENPDMLLVQIPKLKEYLILHKEFNQ